MNVDGVKSLVSGISEIREGEIDEQNGKTVRKIIITCNKANIYLDDDLNVEYTVGESNRIDGYEAVLNRAAHLEARSGFIPDESQLMSVRFLIGKAYSSLYVEQSIAESNNILNIAEAKVNEQARNYSKSWYFTSTLEAAGVCFVLLLATWLFRVQLQPYIGLTAFHVLLGSLIGGFGALLSVYTRSEKLEFDATAGKKLHQIEGYSRVILGFGGGLLASLAIKSGIIFNTDGLGNVSLSLLLLTSLISGATERLVPSITTIVERNLGQKP